MDGAGSQTVIATTFNRIGGHADQIADLFYERLFAAAPTTRALFDQRLEPQRQRFMIELGWLADAAADIDAVRDRIGALGVRHVGYGVEPHHYPVMRTALLDAFAAALGDDWTAAEAQAWGELIDSVAQIMISAAEQA